MAVLYVALVSREETAMVTETTATWKYHVQLEAGDAVSMARSASLDGVSIPTIGTLVDGMFVKSVEARTGQEENFYDVIVNWSSNLADDVEPPAEPSDDKWNIGFSITGVSYQHREDFDYSSPRKPVLNSALDRFEDTFYVTRYDEEIRCSYYTDTPPVTTMATCRGKINSSEVTFSIKGISRTFAARKLLFVNGTVDVVWQNGVAYWGVELIFHGRSDDEFDYKVLDQGYNYLVAGQKVKYPDAYGNTGITPGLLDGVGGKTNTPTTLTFKNYREADLNALFSGL